MKFGKKFRSQMVPEWLQVYMDYKQLKRHLKQVKYSRLGAPWPSAVRRSITLYRAFSGLTKSGSPLACDAESQVILVHDARQDGEQSYETRFLRATEEGGEYEVVFFRQLDGEFNKVLRFYEQRVGEVTNEASVKLALDAKASRDALYATVPFAARVASSKIDFHESG